MELFITEKPSVAMEFGKALGLNVTKRKDGYIEDNGKVVTWCVGHLITMSYPDAYDESLKTWSLDTLPFLPGKYKYEVIKDVAKQYKIVKELLNRKDTEKIFYSGDSAREGEYIQRLVRMMAGYNKSASEYRVWIDSQTKEEILNGIKNAKPLSAYDNLSDSAYARAIEDYLVGMNFSRALSIKYASLVNQSAGREKGAIAVGRVMSCVLGLIVERERLIRSTKSIPFYGIKAELENGLLADWKIVEGSKYHGHPDCYKDNGMLKKELTENLIQELSKTGSLTVKDIKESKESKGAPLLFNLAELQSECTKKFHISPAETLQIAQTLYEKKLTTYPRTDARVLTTAICKVIDKNVEGLKNMADVQEYAEEVISNSWTDRLRAKTTKYVDDSKVSDHYAIIPTGQGFESLSGLSELEKSVYILICRRFLSIFYDACVYDKMAVTYICSKEQFVSSYTAVAREGWLKVAGHKDDSEDRNAMNLVKSINESISAAFSIKEGASQPPKRYTTGSMILAMENAGNLIEEPELREQIKGSGIGTSATRAEVVSKLEKNGYIKVNKKTQVIQPDLLGELIYDVLHESCPAILNPKYTASWETGLSKVQSGEIEKDKYLEKIYNYVRTGVSQMKDNDVSENIVRSAQALAQYYPNIKKISAKVKQNTDITCPSCGKPMRFSDKSLFCTGYKDGCTFSIFREQFGKKLTEKILSDAVAGAERSSSGLMMKTPKISGFKSKKGTTYTASLIFTYSTGERTKTELSFD